MKRMIAAAVMVVLVAMAGCSGGSGGSGGSGDNNNHSSIPAGAFWCSATVSVDECIPVIGSPDVEVCAPKAVDQVMIGEESTGEDLGLCIFGDSDIAVTGRFWCQRIPAAGGVTEIKVYSMQANLPKLTVRWFRTDGGTPAGIHYEEDVRPAVLNGPDGTGHTDPYKEVSFTFAGYKKLIFSAKDKDYNFMQEKALQPLRDAGYDASMNYLSPGNAEVSVYETLDGRAKMTEDTLRRKGWKVKESGTRGNLGTYEYEPSMSIGAMPLYVTEFPTSGEKQVSGMIEVERESEAVEDALVRVNGIPIPHASGGFYDLAAVDLSGGPGTTLVIEVQTFDPEETRTMTLACPGEPKISSPEAYSTVVAGPTTVNWSPGIPANQGVMRLVNFACYKDASGDIVHGKNLNPVDLSAGQTSEQIELGECRRYLLQLQYPGERVFVQNENDPWAFDIGYCSVQHRIWLNGPE